MRHGLGFNPLFGRILCFGPCLLCNHTVVESRSHSKQTLSSLTQSVHPIHRSLGPHIQFDAHTLRRLDPARGPRTTAAVIHSWCWNYRIWASVGPRAYSLRQNDNAHRIVPSHNLSSLTSHAHSVSTCSTPRSLFTDRCHPSHRSLSPANLDVHISGLALPGRGGGPHDGEGPPPGPRRGGRGRPRRNPGIPRPCLSGLGGVPRRPRGSAGPPGKGRGWPSRKMFPGDRPLLII